MAQRPGFPFSDSSDIVAAVYRWSWLLALAFGLWATPAAAQRATEVQVYASGLINPKGMAFTADGSLYVAESGQPGEVMVPLPASCSRIGTWRTTPVVGDGRLYAVTWMLGGEPSDKVKMPGFDELLQKHDKDKDGKLSKEEFPADLSILNASHSSP